MREHHTQAAPPEQGQVAYAPLEGYPAYRVGDDGSVWSNFTRVYGWYPGAYSVTGGEWRRKKPARTKEGYRSVALYQGGKVKRFYVHCLVLTTFVGPCLSGMECRHLDGNPANNRLGNLRWGTKRENAADRARHGRQGRGSASPSAKLLEDDVRWVWLLSSWGHSHKVIARILRVGSSTVDLILRRSTWTHVEPPEGTCDV